MIRLTTQSLQPAPQRPALLFAFEGEEGFANRSGTASVRLRRALEKEGFKGRGSEGTWEHSEGALVVGLGRRAACRVESYRRAGGRAARLSRTYRLGRLTVDWTDRGLKGDLSESVKAFAEGLVLGDYKFTRYKTREEDLLPGLETVLFRGSPRTLPVLRRSLPTAALYAESACAARDLVNGGPSDVTPKVLADTARRMADPKKGLSVKVFNRRDLERMGAGGILGVNRGSAQEPFLIHLHYRPRRASRGSLALVGKGITFDSGGLSLKPAGSMETMKMDMAGAAAVLGTFRALPALAPGVEVHGIIPTTENMPGGRASKPGDVFRAMNGKTMEVLNTDAEGRLILADGLSYAVRQKPDAIVDMATLTGACVIALGALVSGALGNDPQLMEKVRSASEAEGEGIWELPLVGEYRADLRSKVADMKNIGGNREAGTIIGGLFLQEFVGETPWVHLDIAGPAWLDRDFPALPYLSSGGSGIMVRSLLTLLKNW